MFFRVTVANSLSSAYARRSLSLPFRPFLAPATSTRIKQLKNRAKTVLLVSCRCYKKCLSSSLLPFLLSTSNAFPLNRQSNVCLARPAYPCTHKTPRSRPLPLVKQCAAQVPERLALPRQLRPCSVRARLLSGRGGANRMQGMVSSVPLLLACQGFVRVNPLERESRCPFL